MTGADQCGRRLWSGVEGFFCQAEAGIRARLVTGVQTCALPIFIGDPSLGTRHWGPVIGDPSLGTRHWGPVKIGRASCRERVYISVAAVSLKQQQHGYDAA